MTPYGLSTWYTALSLWVPYIPPSRPAITLQTLLAQPGWSALFFSCTGTKITFAVVVQSLTFEPVQKVCGSPERSGMRAQGPWCFSSMPALTQCVVGLDSSFPASFLMKWRAQMVPNIPFSHMMLLQISSTSLPFFLRFLFPPLFLSTCVMPVPSPVHTTQIPLSAGEEQGTTRLQSKQRKHFFSLHTS